MRILFLGINYAPESIGIAKYSAGLCEVLAERGHDIQVVAAKPYYPQWRIMDGFGWGWKRTREHGVDIVRCPLFVPANPTGARRILHHLSFALSAMLPLLVNAMARRPDVVMTVAPSLVAAPLAWLAARISGARCWLHIQDFEVEAAFATGLLDGRSAFARLALWGERRVIGLFDIVSSISPEMCTTLQRKGIADDRIIELRNWADLDVIRTLAASSSYRTDWDIETPNVALYSGNIANKQGIEIVVEAANLLRDRTDLTFVICGQGPNRRALEQSIAGLPNIQIHDLQPTERLGALLGLATVHLLPQRADAADLVLPSKLTNMLASGKPIVACAQKGTGLHREMEGCGIAVTPDDPQAFAMAIETLIDDLALAGRLGLAGRQRAEHVWDRRQIIGQMEVKLQQMARQ